MAIHYPDVEALSMEEYEDNSTDLDDCGSCGAVIDRTIALPGEPYHEPHADCRTVHPFDECDDCYRTDGTHDPEVEH